MKTVLSSLGRIVPYLFYLAFVYFLMCLWRPAKAQSAGALQIGDTLPEVTVSRVMNMNSSTVKLSDFKGKLLIIDFWATWCAPCVTMLPRIDSLQKQFEGKAYFLSVTSEPESKVTAFLDKYARRHGKRIQLPTVVGDTLLHKLFYHSSIPHYVWIDESGVVRAVTEMGEITAPKINAFLAKNAVLTQKQDEQRTAYSAEKPFLAGSNGGDGARLIYHSVLSKYVPGIPGGFSWKIDSLSGRRITITNCARIWLYRIAYGKPGGWFHESNVRLVTRDSLKLSSQLYGERYLDWMRDGNGFCYEIIVPASFQQKTNELMQGQLRDFFPQYTAEVVCEKRQSLALVRLGAGGVIESGGGAPVLEIGRMGWKVRNVSPARLVARLNQLQSHKLTIVDQTGLNAPIDMDVEAGLSDIEAMNRQLSRFGLAFVEKQTEQEVLVISDKN
ncbi:TlpA family protein disulfide reductase [Dyadobacter soli]|nr:TlpA family protein disulfide reductase [Dyadobacter soli]